MFTVRCYRKRTGIEPHERVFTYVGELRPYCSNDAKNRRLELENLDCPCAVLLAQDRHGFENLGQRLGSKAMTPKPAKRWTR